VWSFIAVVLLVVAGLVLVTPPAVGWVINALTMPSAVLLTAFWASLVIWLALLGKGRK